MLTHRHSGPSAVTNRAVATAATSAANDSGSRQLAIRAFQQLLRVLLWVLRMVQRLGPAVAHELQQPAAVDDDVQVAEHIGGVHAGEGVWKCE